LLSFDGIGLDAALAPDLEVLTPYKEDDDSPDYEKLKLEYCWAYVSVENALQIESRLFSNLKSTAITRLGWWIGSFDEEAKAWFSECYPKSPLELAELINELGGQVALNVAEDNGRSALVMP
jgi:hypothetical protein